MAEEVLNDIELEGVPITEAPRVGPSLGTRLDNPNDYCITEFLNAISDGDTELVILRTTLLNRLIIISFYHFYIFIYIFVSLIALNEWSRNFE